MTDLEARVITLSKEAIHLLLEEFKQELAVVEAEMVKWENEPKDDVRLLSNYRGLKFAINLIARRLKEAEAISEELNPLALHGIYNRSS